MSQPPSGGCVLKLEFEQYGGAGAVQPPSGGCVLKQTWYDKLPKPAYPAAFGRLCVETMAVMALNLDWMPSRLRAAVC